MMSEKECIKGKSPRTEEERLKFSKAIKNTKEREFQAKLDRYNREIAIFRRSIGK